MQTVSNFTRSMTRHFFLSIFACTTTVVRFDSSKIFTENGWVIVRVYVASSRCSELVRVPRRTAPLRQISGRIHLGLGHVSVSDRRRLERGWFASGTWVTVDDELVKLLSPSWVVSSTGKSESIWDRFVHEGNNIENGWTGDVACDSYHKWEEDIKLLVEMGVLYLTLERIDVRYHLNWFLS